MAVKGANIDSIAAKCANVNLNGDTCTNVH